MIAKTVTMHKEVGRSPRKSKYQIQLDSNEHEMVAGMMVAKKQSLSGRKQAMKEKRTDVKYEYLYQLRKEVDVDSANDSLNTSYDTQEGFIPFVNERDHMNKLKRVNSGSRMGVKKV